MHLYMSGTPTNDVYQTVENRMNTHRLFSMHGSYEGAVLKWVGDLREGILDADDYMRKYPDRRDRLIERDQRRREKQKDYCRTFDWNTAEVLEHVCKTLGERPYPKAILLDSGAFTAWNKGETTTVDDVRRKYSRFITAAGDLFDEIWAINLDVIPGERGRDPTPDELKRAVEVSDINFEILVKEFGNVILPVYHQGEPVDRLAECVEQVNGRSNYICVSPRNDLAETLRVAWSRDTHAVLRKQWPEIKTHGLATTGNDMVRTVPWFSGDSAAWVQHGGFGMVDIFHDAKNLYSGKPNPHYMNYFVSLENAALAIDGKQPLRDGSLLDLGQFGFLGDEFNAAGELIRPGTPVREIAETLVANGVHPDDFLFDASAGHREDQGKSYWAVPPERQAYIRSRVEALGFPFEVCMWDSRVRNLVCMAEFVKFAEWAKGSERAPAQTYLLGDL